MDRKDTIELYIKELEKLDELGDSRKELEKKEEELKRVLATIEQHLISIMEEEGVLGYTLEDGSVILKGIENYVSVRAENKSEAFCILTKLGYDQHLNINGRTLRNLIEDDLKLAEELKDFLNQYREAYIEYKKRKTKRKKD